MTDVTRSRGDAPTGGTGPEEPGRGSVRARSGRRPLPPLIFLLVLAVASLFVWWNVLHNQESGSAGGGTSATAAKAPPSLDPHTVHLRVLNATDQQGLAQDVAAKLQARGFVIDEVGNDSSGRPVTGPGEIRHGPRGKDQAAYVALYVPGAQDYPDTRATAQVDVVVGPSFHDLASPEQVAAALSGAPRSSAAHSSGAATSPAGSPSP